MKYFITAKILKHFNLKFANIGQQTKTHKINQLGIHKNPETHKVGTCLQNQKPKNTKKLETLPPQKNTNNTPSCAFKMVFAT